MRLNQTSNLIYKKIKWQVKFNTKNKEVTLCKKD